MPPDDPSNRPPPADPDAEYIPVPEWKRPDSWVKTEIKCQLCLDTGLRPGKRGEPNIVRCECPEGRNLNDPKILAKLNQPPRRLQKKPAQVFTRGRALFECQVCEDMGIMPIGDGDSGICPERCRMSLHWDADRLRRWNEAENAHKQKPQTREEEQPV